MHKLTKRRELELRIKWKDYNRTLANNYVKKISFKEFLDRLHGKKTQAVNANTNFKWSSSGSLRPGADNHKLAPSNLSMDGDTRAAASKTYSGTLVKGIGTMHKSNAVPIIDEEHMKDIARMRR